MDAVSAFHPDDQTLHDYALGKLEESRYRALEEHLENCPACRGRVAAPAMDTFLERFREARGSSILEQTALGVASAPAAGSLPPGLANHPDYTIKQELGRGGMGVVYLAHNAMMGRDEVLKVMGERIIERPGVLERFQREIRAVANLRHPNIVAAYTAFRIEGGLVFAMEYVPGLDLHKLVRTKGPLPIVHAAYFLHQAALGLQHAHERGMVHRDIKPHNLMLTHDGKARIVKVLDFGLSKANREQTVDRGLTSEGQALGTPDYIAPEQILDAQSADIRADLYSLGGTLYYLLSGRPPFLATSLYDIYQAHISREPDPLSQLRPEIPTELVAVVAKLLAKDPARRFQTPVEVAQALTPFFKPRHARGTTEISQLGTARTQPAPPSPNAEKSPAVPLLPQAASPAPTVGDDAHRAATEPDQADELPAGSAKRPRWVWPSVAAAVLAILVVAGLAGRILVKTPEGVIVLENLPSDADVFVDGRAVSISWPGSGKPVEVRAVPGKRRVEVRKEGFRTFGESVTIQPSGSVEITVRLEPGLAELPGKPGEAPPSAPLSEIGANPSSPAVPAVDATAYIVAGSWHREGDDLIQANTDPKAALLLLGESALSEFNLSFTAKVLVGDRFHAVFQYLDRNRQWVLQSGNGDGQEISLGRWRDDNLTDIAASSRVPTEVGREYRMRIEIRKSISKFYRDDQLLFVHEDRTFQPGRVGLGSWRSQVLFKDIAITSPDGQPIWKGPPSEISSVLLSAPPRENLVVFYGFDDGQAADLSGHGHDGLIGDAPPTPVVRQGTDMAMEFDRGNNSRIIMPVNINSSVMPRITMGGWFLTRQAVGSQTLITHDDGYWDRTLTIDGRNRGTPSVEWAAFVGDVATGAMFGKPVEPGVWTFVAMRHDQATGTMTIDVDDTRRSRENISFGPGTPRTRIGFHHLYPNRGFDGQADDIFVYDTVLSDAQIDRIRTTGRQAILGN